MKTKRTGIEKVVVLLAVIAVLPLSAGIMPHDSTGNAAPNQYRPCFAGINLLAPFPSMLPVPGNTLFSVLSNLEGGIGASGGMFFRDCQAIEVRLAYGPNSRSERIFNSQMYYNYYFRKNARRYFKGVYTGTGLRYWDLYNELANVHRNNIAGEIDVGYRFNRQGPLYIDLRINEIIGIYSWLSAEHTTGGWASLFSPSLPKSPLINIDAGWIF